MRLDSVGPIPAAGLLVIAILAQAAGNVCLSIGMKDLAAFADTNPGQWLTVGLHAAANLVVVSGVALLVVFFLLFAYLLSHLDLSLAMPIISFEVVLNVACGHWILNETVSAPRWIGTLLVAIGVTLVGWSTRRHKKPARQKRARH